MSLRPVNEVRYWIRGNCGGGGNTTTGPVLGRAVAHDVVSTARAAAARASRARRLSAFAVMGSLAPGYSVLAVAGLAAGGLRPGFCRS
jgi:hypothetical protein